MNGTEEYESSEDRLFRRFQLRQNREPTQCFRFALRLPGFNHLSIVVDTIWEASRLSATISRILQRRNAHAALLGELNLLRQMSSLPPTYRMFEMQLMPGILQSLGELLCALIDRDSQSEREIAMQMRMTWQAAKRKAWISSLSMFGPAPR